jgi:uncharacterized protein (TIGR02996 family)
MSDEDSFLRAILANPADDAPRLIYADWLDEKGDRVSEIKAAYLRDTTALMMVRATPERVMLEDRLKAAAAKIDSRWLAVVSKLQIEACDALFQLSCPKQWENLKPTEDPRIRHCDSCGKSVYFSDTILEARTHAQRGRCVALNVIVPGRVDNLNPLRRFEPSEVAMLGGLWVDDGPSDTGESVDEDAARYDRIARAAARQSRRDRRRIRRSRKGY